MAANVERSNNGQTSTKRLYDSDVSTNTASSSPPAAKPKLNPDTEEFADKFLNMILNDQRVANALAELLLVPVLTKLEERDSAITSLTERVKGLEDTTNALQHAL